MWKASVWCTVDLTRDEHALYTSRSVIGCGPYEGIREQETDSTAQMQCAATSYEGRALEVYARAKC